jgi:quinolinate synthase
MGPIELPTLPPVAQPALAPEQADALKAEVRALAAERNAVILAHNYQVPEIQDVAHFVGDSLGLSRKASETDADAIAFCGVHFMAETASILCPGKIVLLPDLHAGCSLADSITAPQLRAWKAEHPGALVVMYVNTTAEVKAETDYCCTSSNGGCTCGTANATCTPAFGRRTSPRSGGPTPRPSSSSIRSAGARLR